MDASRATSYRDPRPTTGGVSRRTSRGSRPAVPGRTYKRIRGSVPARDDRPAIRAAPDLADDPRIDLSLLVVGRGRDPELVEQAALDRIVVLQQRMIRNVLAIGFDGLQHGAANIAEAAWQCLAHALADLNQRVQRA